MFAEDEFQEPIVVDQNNEDNVRDEEYKRQIMIRVLQFAGLLYLVYGVFIAYVWTSKELDKASSNRSITYYFWDPAITVYSFGNLTVFALILLSKYWIYAANNMTLLHKTDINIIACLMLIPLFLASAVFKILELIRDIAIIPCHGYMLFSEPLSSLALLIGTAILVFDVRHYSNKFANWKKCLLKSNLMFLTMIGITNCLVITVAVQHVHIFRHESNNSAYENRFSTNETCINSSYGSQSIYRVFKHCDKYLRPTYILFCICTLAYLIQLQSENESHDESQEMEPLLAASYSVESETDSRGDGVMICETATSDSNVNFEQPVSYRLPSGSLVLCITFLSLSLLNFIIIFSLRQNTSFPWQRNLGSLIFCSFISIVYILGSGLSVLHIVEIKRWPMSTNRRGNIIDKCLIWIGAGGQIIQSITSISKSIVLMVDDGEDNLLIALLVMMIFSSLLVIVQSFLQTLQVSLFLDRKWIRPEINSWAESMCPAVGMMGLNMGLLLLSLDHLKSPIMLQPTDEMFVDLFVQTLTSVGETLGILQRLHASLLFASMIIYTHN